MHTKDGGIAHDTRSAGPDHVFNKRLDVGPFVELDSVVNSSTASKNFERDYCSLPDWLD